MSTINKFLDLKWRRKLKRRFRLLSMVLLRLYPLKTANKPLRRVFLHSYISSNFNYKRSFIARQKARVASLLRLQGVITKRFYGGLRVIRLSFKKYPSKKFNKTRLSLMHVLNIFKQIRNQEAGYQSEFVLQNFWKRKLARFLFNRKRDAYRQLKRGFRKYRRNKKRIYFKRMRRLRVRIAQKVRKIRKISGRFFIISGYCLSIRKVLNNMFLTASTRSTGNVLDKRSGGMSSVKGSKRTAFVAMEEISQSLSKSLLQQGLIKRRKKIDVYFNTPFIDKANKTIVRIFAKARLRIARKRVKRLVLRNLIVARRYCHNGIRPAKKRRV